ncbi:MAG: CDP-diacylglycerol--serine O-phosphatidyltransferase [Cytophagaceae bacterium]|nr:CDP-diacylglycerol--serine O-phosphatidyltransferase [Cytophagaceae bacterium]
MKLLRHLPNALTCANLLCGGIGVVRAMEGDLVTAGWLIGLAGVLDFLDGFVARALRVQSLIGKELDSLADVVTFGLLPTLLIFQLIRQSQPLHPLLPYVAFALVVCSALRLAKFNIDTRQSDSFIGVPTPANGILVASLPLILTYQPRFQNLILNLWVLLGYSVVMAYLMVSELPLFALKFKSFGWQGNRLQFSFLGLSAMLLVLLNFAAIPLIVGLYIGLSVLTHFFKKRDSAKPSI